MIDLKSIGQKLLEEKKDTKSVDYNLSLLSDLVKETKEALTLDYERIGFSIEEMDLLLENLDQNLTEFLAFLPEEERQEKREFYLGSLPSTKELLSGTVDAILSGDPASDSRREIILTYPGYRAILSYRIANLFYKMGLFLPARIISEEAHRETGIDINPGATIGKNFFIDHGTGIVIGETALIGNDVKIYQGVTLGALFLSRGRTLKGLKRHPTVKDHVTIFGGDTIIGENTTIGANVYLTSSVEPDSIVYLGKEGIRTIQKVKNP
jgi:serine O-acetyltransferase